MHTSLSTPPSTVRISRILAEDVVKYARWFKELIKGSVEVQSRARRSYRAVVMPTDALLTFGMEKLTSLIVRTENEELLEDNYSKWIAAADKRLESVEFPHRRY